MELRALPSSALSEHLISCIVPRYIKIKNICKLNLKEKAAATRRSFDQLLRFNLRCSAKGDSATVSASNAHGMELSFSNIPPHDARILYSVAPSMGHNKENHPESNLRVPAIVNALEAFELTSKYRGLEVFEMQNFPPASVDDIARVHARAYVAGLEKAMSRATDEGIIFIDGSGPTYATETTFQESLIAAGAGLSLVDSVVGSYPGTGKIEQVGQGKGEGTTLNLPLPGGSGDYAMRNVFDEVIAPCAQRFKPDIILVSAGYDAHVLDPLAGLQFTAGTYYMLASSIKQLAKELCKGRCVFFLEGGYNLQSLSHSVVDTFRAFLGEPSLAPEFDDPAILYEEPLSKAKQVIQKVKHLHSL
ncbi:histone deacetylase 14 isoform X3 [Dendrobium catenatum]|uniref:histone deacetylase 14 isoform X3 n=1 Tax=Dendrobium catenatum TaxID=906689 RepID=UPI0010A05606|nr:histone deacetylase 14 isoform X3 [Dendrobium catenatum]